MNPKASVNLAATKFVFSIIASLAAASAPLGHADDWPRWRGPDLNGISRETDWRANWLDEDPPIVWKASVGIGFSSMTVGNGRLYTLGNQDDTETVYCFDAETGKKIWTQSYKCPLDPKYFEGGPTSTPTIDGDRVYTLSRYGHLFCFDAATGDIVWSQNIAEKHGLPLAAWGFSGSPLVHEKLLLLNAGEAGLALDKTNGDLEWKSAKAEAGYSTPLPLRIGEKWQLLVSSGKSYSAVDLLTGKALWRMSWLTRYGVNAADPVPVAGNRYFISSGYEKGAALFEVPNPRGSETEVLWKNKEMRSQMNPCVLIDGYLYGADGNDGSGSVLKCLEATTGKTKWEEKGFGNGGVMAANGKLIALSERGELLIAKASPEEFDPTAQVQVLGGKCWTVPVLANGRIYCRNAEGDLVCVDVRKS